MSYRTYSTTAFVCGSFARNTSDMQYRLFTREFGMLYAGARSVREEKSKQRYALQDFSFVTISLIKGKYGWRIGSVIPEKNVFYSSYARDGRQSVHGLVKLLIRFVHGEEPIPEIYDLLENTFFLLNENKIRHPEYFVTGVKFQMLYLLGYIAVDEDTKEVALATKSELDREWNDKLYHKLKTAIDNAEVVSHL